MVQPEQVVDTYLAQWPETDLSNRASVDCGHDSDTSEITHESGIVTALYRSCRTQLSRLSAVLASSSQRCRILLTEIRSKLVIFGGSLENGKLESCLNVNDEVKDDILLILYEIGTILAYDIFQHACKDLVAFRDDDTSTTLKDCLASVKAALTAESGSDTSEDESASEDDKRPNDSVNARTLERQCLRPLAKNVDLLMFLYPTLEQIFRDQHQPPRARLPRPIPKISVTGSALPYVHNVRDKFPKADKDLAERLGEANWQRHERLKAARTSGASEQPILAKAELPKSIFQPISEIRDSALGESLASSPARAPSVASHSSYLSSIEGGEKEHFRVPKMPAGADYHIAFSCPYCGERASMRNRIDWKMHVFADLQAYICTHPECSEGWATFPSRRKWFEHETTYHMTRNRFRCTQLNCTLVLEMEEEYLTHVRGSHAISFETSANKWSLLNAATISTVQPVESLRCPLCHISDWTTYRKYEKHLGKHQEEIALCALPPSAYDNDNDDDHDAGGHEGAYDSASSTSRKEVNDLEGHDGLGPDKRDAQMSNLSRRRSRLPTNKRIYAQSPSPLEPFKDLIFELYIGKRRPLEEVIVHMFDAFGVFQTVKQYKTKLSDWGFKHNLKTTDAAHILRLLNQAKTEGLPEVVMWAFQPKTREDIANFIRRQSTLNDEAHLLSKISDEDKTPHYIELAGIDVLSSPTNNIPDAEKATERQRARRKTNRA